MRTILLRVTRRRTAWESTDPDEIVQLEFTDRHARIELSPSVYELEVGEGESPAPLVLRAHAEHAASFLCSPPPGGTDVDMGGLGAVVEGTPGTSAFAFTARAHRQLRFESAAELRALVARILADLGARAFPVSRDDIVRYAAERLAAGDEEWSRALAEESTAHGWRRSIARLSR